WISDANNIDPIVKQFGFITCSATVGDDHCGLPASNLCNKSPIAAPTGPLSALFPTDIAAGGQAIPLKSHGTGTTCSTQSCVSTGGACVATACPAANGRPANSACSVNSDCAAGLTCQDVLAFGQAGQGLLCAP